MLIDFKSKMVISTSMFFKNGGRGWVLSIFKNISGSIKGNTRVMTIFMIFLQKIKKKKTIFRH